MAPFTVLHVCMGNICRSPMAERLLARAVQDRSGDPADQLLRSVSAGTGGWHEGEEMNPPAARQVRSRRRSLWLMCSGVPIRGCIRGIPM